MAYSSIYAVKKSFNVVQQLLRKSRNQLETYEEEI
jgi:hypothetical protein